MFARNARTKEAAINCLMGSISTKKEKPPMASRCLRFRKFDCDRVLSPPMKKLTLISCFVWTSSAWRNSYLTPSMSNAPSQPQQSRLFSSSSPTDQGASSITQGDERKPVPESPLYLQEGLFAVEKPLEWTSQDVVGKVRWILEQDAKNVRSVPDRRKKRRRPWMKVGHGGTLDPLATGVLVVGVGKGTKQLQQYLTGSKGYRAGVELGFQTTTLDMDPKGEVVARKSFDHVTFDAINDVLERFRGTIQQTPPIFSALKKDGKRMYELGREGTRAEDIEIEAREVQIHRLELLRLDDDPSKFELDVECGGGTYIRSLVRDIGLALDTVATMTSLERTKQGPFLPEHCLHQSDWTPDGIWNAIEKSNPLWHTLDNEK